jgi:hypothetical protein
LPLAARLYADLDPFIAVATQADERTFSCRAFATDPVGAMTTARVLEKAAHAAVGRRLGATEAALQSGSAMQFEYVLPQNREPDILDFFGDDEPSWPYEVQLAGKALKAGREPTRAAGEARVRMRIGALLRSDPAVTSLLEEGAPLRCRYSHGWYPAKPGLKVTFGLWDRGSGLPVALANQHLADILTVLIGAVPLRRKTAVEFYDADRGVKRL